MAWDATQRKRDAAPWNSRDGFSKHAILVKEPAQDNLKLEPATTLLSPIGVEAAVSPHRPLLVKVAIRFADPVIRSTYRREYASSPTFEPTDRICRGLLRRIEHCSEELVTRNDPDALQTRLDETQPLKPLKYVMTFHIIRHGTGVWAERTFSSYQKRNLTTETARDVVRSSHRMIGLFLRRHDPAFRWADHPAREDFTDQPSTVKPSFGGPLSLCCIPRSRFIESSQTFEFVPGFTIELSFRSRSRARKQYEWKRVLKLNSEQTSPLNLALAEDLLWRTSKAVSDTLDSKREEFYEDHKACEWLEGVVSCQHFEEDALDIELRITNNLGPSYGHLHRMVRTKLGLFRHPDGADCYQCLGSIQAQLAHARDVVDARLSEMNDFDLRILELRGRGWKVDNPARFCLGPSNSYSRRSIEAILARVQSGVADVLRGNDIAIHLGAYKRGHLVLDKAMIAHAEPGKTWGRFSRLEDQGETFVSRIKARIQQDLDMICKDTCCIDDIPEELESIPQSLPDVSEAEPAVEKQVARSAVELPADNPAQRWESRPKSPGPRVFPLVPERYSPRVSCDLSGTIDIDASKSVRSNEVENTEVTEKVEVMESNEAVGEGDLGVSATADCSFTPARVVAFEQGTKKADGETTDCIKEQMVPEVDGEDCSEPSTPGLSSGADTSPRTSLLITPTMLRTQSGTHIPLSTEPDIACEVDKQSETEVSGEAVDDVNTLCAEREDTTVKVMEIYPLLIDSAASSQRSPAQPIGVDVGQFESVTEPAVEVDAAKEATFEEEFSRTKPDLDFDEDAEAPDVESPSDSQVALTSRSSDKKSNVDVRDASGVPQGMSDIDGDRQSEAREASKTAAKAKIPTEVMGTQQSNSFLALDNRVDFSGDRPWPLSTSESLVDDAGRNRHLHANVSKPSETIDRRCEDRVLDIGHEACSGPDDGANLPDPVPDSGLKLPAREVFSQDTSEPAEIFVPKLLGECSHGQSLADDVEGSKTTTPELVVDDGGSRSVSGSTLFIPDGLRASLFSAFSRPTTPSESGSSQVLKMAKVPELSSFGPARPAALAPAPMLLTRTSTSSDWEDYGSAAEDEEEYDKPRDSVETVDDLDGDQPDSSPTARRLSIPIAGYLGLHETKLVEMGLRGALVGSHRFDTPTSSHSRSKKAADRAAEASSPKSSPTSPHLPHRRKRAKSAASKAVLTLPKPKKRSKSADLLRDGQVQDRPDGVLPRVIMMFAGMAVASQMMNRSS